MDKDQAMTRDTSREDRYSDATMKVKGKKQQNGKGEI